MAAGGYRNRAGASAGRMGKVTRIAERAVQHRRARVALPLLSVAAAPVGWTVGTVGTWQLGLVAALVVVGLGARRLYRRAHNSWAAGAAGEARTARLLAPLVRRGHAVVLHDRAVPGSRANLDHLVFTAAGAAYVDTKNWTSGKSWLTVRDGVLGYGRYDRPGPCGPWRGRPNRRPARSASRSGRWSPCTARRSRRRAASSNWRA
ncbi:NERD domain-containing protein [Streptomyces sp. NBC_00414]|uniref:nuclease-related domain-containing protein n=1 Tax=Streptomyces sp. NBC_00414 TaxID=2975739 RepID=UPI002E1FD9F9